MSNLSSSEEADEALNVLSTTSDGSSAHHQQQPLPSPGNPDPSAEVIALSPRTLMATNRFICEVCNKGFQREQNLQLHMRGHNLPWKLKQKTSGSENKNQVYICPEISCIHHNPACALGDLTGIKKHFSRKHGEKKWKCDKCSKKYAVQSDWEAHSKTCGTKEYKCDCGTIFSRKDSFVTHRAFCDALAKEVLASSTTQLATTGTGNTQLFSELITNTSILNLLQINNSNMKNLPVPSKMAGSMFSSSSSFNQPGTNSSNMSTSATLLLQQAAQMGATVSSNMNFPINNVVPKSYASPFSAMQIPILPSDYDRSQAHEAGSNTSVHGFVGSMLQSSGDDHHQKTSRLMQIESGWYNNANSTSLNEEQRILNINVLDEHLKQTEFREENEIER